MSIVYLVFKAFADWFEVSVYTLCIELSLSLALPVLRSTVPLSWAALSLASMFLGKLFSFMRFLGDARKATWDGILGVSSISQVLVLLNVWFIGITEGGVSLFLSWDCSSLAKLLV